MAIAKLEAAQRQLDCAIRLYIDGEDLLPVHTLSRAAFRVLFDIYPSHRSDGFTTNLTTFIETTGWKRFNEAANFLKHADKDPTAHAKVEEGDTQMGVGFGIVLDRRLTDTSTPEMMAFDSWMKSLHPENFMIPPDPDPDIEALAQEGIALIKAPPREHQLRLARAYLTYFSQHPYPSSHEERGRLSHRAIGLTSPSPLQRPYKLREPLAVVPSLGRVPVRKPHSALNSSAVATLLALRVRAWLICFTGRLVLTCTRPLPLVRFSCYLLLPPSQNQKPSIRSREQQPCDISTPCCACVISMLR
ncbi:hypothetical protein IVA80_16465 [Bradyrhizobium sp. 139]|uniref:hypothetical protein n=1 Tax=Bradyrhizobium sp. 139 TaxID=2782616 RepID=UPI001FFC29A6|nr:hypothetical protein [Bradyrhizobium sp. 139]MCK1742413.1 hypothetical protein [Bradyrhizobium sp. 139]